VTGFVAGGYTLVMPPGWVRLPVRSTTPDSMDAVIDQALPRQVPRDDRIKARLAIRARLGEAVDDARGSGALDIYLALGGMYGLAVPASFVVTDIPVTDTQDPDRAFAELGAAPGAELVKLDGVPAVRTDEVIAPDPMMIDIGVPSRRISYVVAVPGAPRWLTVVFSTVGDGEPTGEFADVLVALFDAMLTTFRFTERDPEPAGS
jgi:hypothetical protein